MIACLQMCCEEDECALAVFNEVEAVCYLKESAALEYSAEHATGVSTITIDDRKGITHVTIKRSPPDYNAAFIEAGRSDAT